METVELMTMDDMLNAIGLAGILFYFLIPTILTILGIYAYNRHKTKAKTAKEQRKIQEQKKEIHLKLLNDDEKAINLLDNTSSRPENPEKFRSLTLEFDKSGNVK